MNEPVGQALANDGRSMKNDTLVWNEYLRMLYSQHVPSPQEFIRPEWQPVQEIGDILVSPEGYRLRIERTPTVGDLLHVGDWIDVFNGKYANTGVIASINSYSRCPCPYDPWGTKVCFPHAGYGRPAILDYHRNLVVWGLTFVYQDDVDRLRRNGKPDDDSHIGHVNELVAVGNEVRSWFETSITRIERLDRPSVDVPLQLSLL